MEDTNQILTEVTTIKEANSNGANIVVPRPEELISKASASFIGSIKKFNELFTKLSVRGKSRVVNAVFDLPQERLPIILKDDVEKAAFMVGQNIINARFTITYYHILKQLQEEKERNNNVSTQEVSETPTTEEPSQV